MVQHRIGRVVLVLVVACATAGCAPAPTPTPPPTATPPPARPTAPPTIVLTAAPPARTAVPPPASAPASIPTAQPPPSPTSVAATPQPEPLPLAEPGPYYTGRRTFSAEDASRGARKVKITVWYPALLPTGSSGSRIMKLIAGDNREPDRSGAPYPLLVSSTKVAKIFGPHLVSHGFAWASVDDIDTYPSMQEQLYSQPLDILFALDQVASNPPEALAGMIDAEHAGAIGYSFDGYNTLAMSGARIDPAYYLTQCPLPDTTTMAILGRRLSAFSCAPAREWEEFTAGVGAAITSSTDGLWQPLTDARLRAVMPLAGEGWWLFGEKGLAAVDRPTLMMVATEDDLYGENALIFEHLGTPDKALISFIGRNHMMIYDEAMVPRMGHFAAAFFGYHLQGRSEYALYFSQEFVQQQDGLAWGVYP